MPLQILWDMHLLSGIHMKYKFYAFVLLYFVLYFALYCIIFSVVIVLLGSWPWLTCRNSYFYRKLYNDGYVFFSLYHKHFSQL